jgi:hypothetical protein
VSFGDISANIEEFVGEGKEKDEKNPYKDTKAFKLISRGKTPVEVAIKWYIRTRNGKCDKVCQ